jgi:hypothetical protein
MATWRKYRNLQASLQEFLSDQVIADNVKDLEGNTVTIRVGRKDSTFTLTTISVYMESETSKRFETGSNLRDDKQLMIIDIFAKNEADRLDLAKWVVDSINDGWPYHTYSNDSAIPDNPTKVIGKNVNVNFLTNGRVKLGDNVDQFDAHRHQITITAQMNGV